jgi:hypothetical protein
MLSSLRADVTLCKSVTPHRAEIYVVFRRTFIIIIIITIYIYIFRDNQVALKAI